MFSMMNTINLIYSKRYIIHMSSQFKSNPFSIKVTNEIQCINVSIYLEKWGNFCHSSNFGVPSKTTLKQSAVHNMIIFYKIIMAVYIRKKIYTYAIFIAIKMDIASFTHRQDNCLHTHTQSWKKNKMFSRKMKFHFCTPKTTSRTNCSQILFCYRRKWGKKKEKKKAPE